MLHVSQVLVTSLCNNFRVLQKTYTEPVSQAEFRESKIAPVVELTASSVFLAFQRLQKIAFNCCRLDLNAQWGEQPKRGSGKSQSVL